MKKHALYATCAILILVFSQTTLASSITISFSPPSQSVSQGTTAKLSVQLSGLGQGTAPSLGTFDLLVNFNSSILTFSSASFGDPTLGDQLNVDGLGVLSSVTPGGGSVDLFELSLDTSDDLNSLQAPGFILSTLTFGTIGSGTSPLSLTVNALGDAYGNSLTANLQAGAITVQAAVVPEPPGLVLIATGLFSLEIFRKFRRCRFGG